MADNSKLSDRVTVLPASAWPWLKGWPITEKHRDIFEGFAYLREHPEAVLEIAGGAEKRHVLHVYATRYRVAIETRLIGGSIGRVRFRLRRPKDEVPAQAFHVVATELRGNR